MKNNKKSGEKKAEKQPVRRIYQNCAYIIRQVWTYSPAYIVVTGIQCILWGLFDSLKVWYIKDLFDRLDRGESFGQVIIPLVIFVCAVPVYYIFHYWFWQVHTQKQRIKLSMGMQQKLFDQARQMDLSAYDDPKFFDDFIWSMKDSDNRFANLISDLGQLFARIISSAALIGILFSIDPVLAAAAIVMSVIRVAGIRVKIKVRFEQSVELNKYDRKTDYYDRVFRLEEYAKEVRSGGIADILLDDFDRNTEDKKRAVYKYGLRLNAWDIFTNLAHQCYNLFAYIYLIHGIIVRNTVTLGGFAAALSSTWQMSSFLNQIFDSVMKFPEHSLYVEKFRQFMDYKPQVENGHEELGRFESLEMRNVSFSYGDTKALNHVNLKIRRGEKIAIVGYNGAGKTTLVKLLLRLYRPDEGEILINGRPAGEYDISSVRSECGAVFQDFRIFAATLGENTENGALAENRRENATNALRMAGFEAKMKSLTDGLDTNLTREFYDDGTNLSGGEGQKVAISRVFSGDFGLSIMDEPSSALDPVAESLLSESVNKYSEGRAVIFISHRLSSAKSCDRIYMFENGEIIECGSHAELMDMNGKYAAMFKLQAEKYGD